MPESWSSAENSSQRSRLRRGPDPLEQGLDRLVSAGRQLVDGVSGARPGVRGPSRGGPSRGAGASASASFRPRLDQLGRWVEDKLDWILDDDEDWREPWQENARPASPQAEPGLEPAAQPSKRRPLEARSRRQERAQAVSDPDAWPDDASFSIPRWQRPNPSPPTSPSLGTPPQSSPVRSGQTGPTGSAGRPLPRSTRLRSSSD